ncbi:MAG: hypothetical protein K2L14_03910 [Duncaniella sp.]|nr:hypothetical protein [Duncaniella sp.]
MRRIVISTFAAILAVVQVSALDLFKKKNSEPVNYNAWRDTTALTMVTAEGLPMFYPETVEDGQAVVRGEFSLPGRTSEQIFLGALDYAVSHLDAEDEHEQIGEFNEADKSFMIRRYSKQGSNNTETVYRCLVLVKAETGRLLFAINEIDVKYREKGLIPRTLAFEKLKPADNSRHRELVELFAELTGAYFHSLSEAAAGSGSLSASHWKEIREKEVVKGMSELEVKLAVGMPLATRDNGDRIRWVYPDNYIVLFENGKVVRVVE